MILNSLLPFLHQVYEAYAIKLYVQAPHAPFFSQKLNAIPPGHTRTSSSDQWTCPVFNREYSGSQFGLLSTGLRATPQFGGRRTTISWWHLVKFSLALCSVLKLPG